MNRKQVGVKTSMIIIGQIWIRTNLIIFHPKTYHDIAIIIIGQNNIPFGNVNNKWNYNFST